MYGGIAVRLRPEDKFGGIISFEFEEKGDNILR